jgi:hypothetical protein
MTRLPVKAELRPTLPDLLLPRWRAASSRARAVAAVAVALLAAMVIGVVLTLVDAHISYRGPVPFAFRYRNLYRVAALPGEDVRVQSPKHGAARESFDVLPLTIPSYQGLLSGELPLFASDYTSSVAARVAGFSLYAEGKTRINKVPGYQVEYWLTVGGRQMLERDVLLLPDRPGVRKGVVLQLRQRPNTAVPNPGQVGSAGALLLPLRSFRFG